MSEMSPDLAGNGMPVKAALGAQPDSAVRLPGTFPFRPTHAGTPSILLELFELALLPGV